MKLPSRISLAFATTLVALSCAQPLRAQATPADWTEPFPPFRIAGNLYYVGSKGLASYLITTPKGHVLINSNLQESIAQLRASVEQLGFKFSDIRILLISHAHWDHDAGSAELRKQTGARYMVMDGDVPVVESGGATDFAYGGNASMRYPPTKVDRVLHDGDKVMLGGTTLVAHLTPGHTKGCTTWTMKVREGGKTYDVAIVGSPNVNPGYRLVDNAAYPEIASDYERTFRVLRSLPVDIFLGAHGSYFDLPPKFARRNERGVNAFVDPAGYRGFVDNRERAFRTELAKQRQSLTGQDAAESTSGTSTSSARTRITMRATGTFEVKVTPQPADAYADGAALGRMTIDKEFSGDLQGVSKGQMLTGMSSVKGSAGYVAIERVTGVLGGRRGAFVLQHSGTMAGGSSSLTITVVPDSGTDELVGLAGAMTIAVAAGKHSYAFEYSLPSQH